MIKQLKKLWYDQFFNTLQTSEGNDLGIGANLRHLN